MWRHICDHIVNEYPWVKWMDFWSYKDGLVSSLWFFSGLFFLRFFLEMFCKARLNMPCAKSWQVQKWNLFIKPFCLTLDMDFK